MWLYTLFIIGIGAWRLYEVKLSQRHFQEAQKRGPVYEVQEWIYPLMVAFHAAWLLACLVEVWVYQRPFYRFWGGLMLLLWLAAVVGRVWVQKTLQTSWNVRVIHDPTQPILDSGPYQYIRHPNYLIVMVEIFCIPMVHGAYLTAIWGSLINAGLIWLRLRTEEAYLASLPGYQEKMGNKPRFIPHPVQAWARQLWQRWFGNLSEGQTEK